MRKIEKVAVIGLDCFEPSLCFDRWLDDLPTIKRLMQGGVYGNLTSSMPPVTVPAWSCMTASKDPGTLGIYGFHDRKDRSYDQMTICTSLRVKEPRLWDILTQQGKTSIVVGVPGTFPITKPIQGQMITGFLTPGTTDPRIAYTHPPGLRMEVQRLVGEYLVDVRMGPGTERREILDQIYEMTDRRFDVVRYLMKEKPWDLMFMVEMGTDRIHHGFWRYMDTGHRQHPPGHEFEHAIHDYYQHIDRQIAKTLSTIEEQTTAVWLVSDHGAKALDGGVLINQWLINEGFLHLKSAPEPRQRFKAADVDWDKTRAWATPGYYGQIFINLASREPKGIVEAADYESVREDLIARLGAMVDDRGRPMGNKCYKPDEIYATCNNVPPDLIVIFADLRWRCSGWVGSDTLYLVDADGNAEDANHAQEGMYLCAHPSLASRGRANATLYDVAPTILKQLGMEIDVTNLPDLGPCEISSDGDDDDQEVKKIEGE